MERRADDRDRATLLAALFGQYLPDAPGHHLLRTSDVALLFQVSERTVSEWARKGRVPSVRTPGGHRRYPVAEIRRLFLENAQLPNS
jgi:excisionase family DNA binding protein